MVQNAQSAGDSETRSFSFDARGNLTAQTVPESGTTTFSFDTAGSQCGGYKSQGNLVQRYDANQNYTCYQYDALNRLVSVTYPSGPNAAASAAKTFVYDAATVDGVAMGNVAGRLAEAYTAGHATDIGFSYPSPANDEADVYQSSDGGQTWYAVRAQYYGNGALASLALPGVPTVTYTLDGTGRPSAASAGGATLATGAAYNAFSEPTAVTLGSGDSDAYTYDAATGRMTQYRFTVNGATDTGGVAWNPNGTLQSLQIADAVPGTADNGLDCGYQQDALGRLSGINCGASTWVQGFTYDAFGNITKTGNQSFGAVYNTQNHITSNGAVQPSYDADGNLISDPDSLESPTFAYDADGHAVTFEGTAAVYDALGRVVAAGGKEFIYGPAGRKLAVMGGGTLERAEVPLPGGGAAVYDASGLDYYTHVDWLGNVRLASTPSRAVASSSAYAPTGVPMFATGTTPVFTGARQDIAAGQYDFAFRELSAVQGRWWTPDPAALAAADPANPQSWDEYAHVGNLPMSNADPLRLILCSLRSAYAKAGSRTCAKRAADPDSGFSSSQRATDRRSQ